MENDEKGAAVKFPPPLIFIIGMAIGYGVQYLAPIALGESAMILGAGKIFFILGVAILIISAILFYKAKTHIEPWKPTSNIISTGLFAYSRNPIYLAFCLITIGIGIVLNSFWVLLSFLPSAFIVFHIAIKKEEQYLQQKFGDEYMEYKQKVRRWM